jgi:hypothetical protein
MTRFLTAAVLLVLAAFLVAGCGGPPSLKDVEQCLKDEKLTVERASSKNDADVKEGVSARSSAESRELTIALAATAKSKDKVKEFTKRFKETTDGLSGQQSAQFQFKSGSDGLYVWAAAGSKDSKKYDAALACVQP